MAGQCAAECRGFCRPSAGRAAAAVVDGSKLGGCLYRCGVAADTVDEVVVRGDAHVGCCDREIGRVVPGRYSPVCSWAGVLHICKAGGCVVFAAKRVDTAINGGAIAKSGGGIKRSGGRPRTEVATALDCRIFNCRVCRCRRG